MSYLVKILIFITLGLYGSSLALYIVSPEFQNFVMMILGGALFCSLTLILWKRNKIVRIIKLKSTRSVITNLLNIFLMSCILGVINFLVVKNDYYIDLTRNNLHSLSEQSLNTLKLLAKHEMKFKLFSQRSNWKKYHRLLKLYEVNTDNIQLEMIDVEKEISLASLHNIKEEGTLVVEYLGKTYRTIAKDELAVTNLLLKILTPNKKKIYYSVGHNEFSLTDKNNIGGDFLREKILNSNFDLNSLEIQKGIPRDASAVMILNPQIEFLDSELKNLRTYLEVGGSMLVTLSPQFNGVIAKNFMNLLNEYGIYFENLLVLDRLAAQQGSQASIPVVNSYSDHKITRGMSDRTLFPISGSFSLNKKNDHNFKWSVLAYSTPFPGSWGERSFEEVKQGKAKFDEGQDLEGPLPIVMAGENEKSRVLAFSSTSFIANQFQGQANNFNFFLNSLSWLVKEEALMSLNRPQLEGNLIYISDIQINLIFYFAIVFFPFLFFGIGIFVFRKRINK